MVMYPGDNIYASKLMLFVKVDYPLPDVLEIMKSHRTLPGVSKNAASRGGHHKVE